MTKRKWISFHGPGGDFDQPGAALKKNWGRLHQGDREPFPSAEWVERVLSDSAAAMKSAGRLGADPEALAEQLQDAWRAFHRGEFQRAAEEGAKLGIAGYVVASKAAGIYANYLEREGRARLELLQEAAARAEESRKALPASPQLALPAGLQPGALQPGTLGGQGFGRGAGNPHWAGAAAHPGT